MPEPPVEALREGYAAFARGDLEPALALLDPEIDIADHDRVLDKPTTYRGPQGLVAMALNAAEGFEDHVFEPQDFDVHGHAVLVTTRRRGRGAESGVDVDELQWHLWEFRGELAVRLRTFVMREDALAALAELETA